MTAEGGTGTAGAEPLDFHVVAAANPDSSSRPSAPSAPGSKPIGWTDLAGVCAFSAGIFFFNLWKYGFWEPDEARYGEIAREMLEGGSFLIPHLNYVIYAEKPPLLYWLTALSFRIFGVSEFSGRFMVALFAIAAVGATAWFAGRTMDRRRGMLAGAVLATIPLYAAMAQVLTTDMILTALVTIANFAMFMQWREGGRWCWIAYTAIALGVLTKGPVAIVLPMLAIVAFLAWQGELRGAARRLRLAGGIALIAALAAPWFIAMVLMIPGFFDFYFIGEHLRRALESSYSHGEPFYFYIPVLAVGMLPWSAMVPFLTWRHLPENPARRFCIAAALTTIAAFSCANAKLIPYILPAIPPVAILIADGLASCAWPAQTGSGVPRPDSRILVESGPLLGLLGAVAVGVAIYAPEFRSPYPMHVRTALFAVGGSLIAGGAITTGIFLSGRTAAGIVSLAASVAIATMGASWARIEAEPLRSYAALARAIAERAPDSRVICYHRYVQSLPFYTRKRIILVGARTELRFGSRLSPDADSYFFKTDDDLMRLWNSPGRKVLVIDEADLARLKDQLGSFELIGSEFHKRAVEKSDERASSH